MGSYTYQRFRYRTPDELAGGRPIRRPVAIVGAGPVGLSAAIDLAQQAVPCVVLDDNDSVSDGSRAICWAKRTLEIFDRLGVARQMIAKGVTWRVGRIYHGDRAHALDLFRNVVKGEAWNSWGFIGSEIELAHASK